MAIGSKSVHSQKDLPIENVDNDQDQLQTIDIDTNTSKDQHRRLGNVHERLLTPSEYTETAKLLYDIRQKVENSPVLNGGFETMLYKVDKIEESQGKIVDSVNVINDAIYQPDDGIFARITLLKSDVNAHTQMLQTELESLDTWRVQSHSDRSDDKKLMDQLNDKIRAQQKTIETLELWKSNVTSMVKWSVTTISASLITIVAKILYDYVVAHVHY